MTNIFYQNFNETLTLSANQICNAFIIKKEIDTDLIL